MENNQSSQAPAIQLDEVIPLGRSGEDYLQMFNLFSVHENRAFLDCAGGPSSFNKQMTELDKKVVSVDPLYFWQKSDIEKRIDSSFSALKEQLVLNQDMFQWDRYKSVDELMAARKEAMHEFLGDFETGKSEGRYVNGSLPELNFADNSFEMALCSHFLFLYSSKLSLDFHIQAIIEMMRVAKECRIFPLFDLSGKTSPYLREVVKQLRDLDYHTQIISVPYEIQKGANQCLIIRKTINNI